MHHGTQAETPDCLIMSCKTPMSAPRVPYDQRWFFLLATLSLENLRIVAEYLSASVISLINLYPHRIDAGLPGEHNFSLSSNSRLWEILFSTDSVDLMTVGFELSFQVRSKSFSSSTNMGMLPPCFVYNHLMVRRSSGIANMVSKSRQTSSDVYLWSRSLNYSMPEISRMTHRNDVKNYSCIEALACNHNHNIYTCTPEIQH